jgi:DNA-directed RNA polymerase alpha subunit
MRTPLDGTIFELPLSSQTVEALKGANVLYLRELVYMSAAELRSKVLLVEDAVREIERALAPRGLSLAMRFDPETGHPLAHPMMLHVIDELTIPTVVVEALKAVNVYYIGHLVLEYSEQDLKRVPGISPARAGEIRRAVQAVGLDLSRE